MREEVAVVLAGLVEAAGKSGDFKILVHGQAYVTDKASMHSKMRLSVLLCENFLGEVWNYHSEWPSPTVIFSKIKNAGLAASISQEMFIKTVMEE